ncbi:hypothetical protein B0H66DRAFT_597354 [Apodospora peruviana]|uniref:Uncharacterized protein n=1 Tax=Apodospora peruviana TaxID=516989 RepID=A0AAE0IRI9_9PEZI|nr:hypothetical protein B0H66DRAFT_597354 [Apodospora peruviana]
MNLQNIFAMVTMVAGIVNAIALPLYDRFPGTQRNVTAVTSFNVTDFRASALILSHRDFYAFDVSCCPNESPVHCEALGTTVNERLSSIPQTWCTNNSTGVSFKWTTRPQQGGSELLIVNHVENGVTDEAVYFVPQNDTPILGQNEFQHQVYTGPKDFTVEAYRFETL